MQSACRRNRTRRNREQFHSAMLLTSRLLQIAHGSGRVVSAFCLLTSISSSTPASAIIYDAYTSIINKLKKKKITSNLRNTNAFATKLISDRNNDDNDVTMKTVTRHFLFNVRVQFKILNNNKKPTVLP